MAHLLADAEQADRAAFGSFPCALQPSSSAGKCRIRLSLHASPRIACNRRYSVRARSSTSNTSRLSPGLMSLVSASSTPHSMPALTSFDIVLEAAQRGDGGLRDDDVLAGEARMQPLADDAFEHQQAGGLVLLAGREDFLDLGAADDRSR